MNQTSPAHLTEEVYYNGYDRLTPMMLPRPDQTCSARMKATLENGQVAVRAIVKTPFGEMEKCFVFRVNTCFKWEPAPGFKYVFIFTQVQRMGRRFRFRAWLQARIESEVWGSSWASYIHEVSHNNPVFQAGEPAPAFAHLTLPAEVPATLARRPVGPAGLGMAPKPVLAEAVCG